MTEPEENVTDASRSQTEPAEPDGGPAEAPQGGGGAPNSGDGKGDAAGPRPPRWSEQQPEPAPWYVGQPGGGPQQQSGWGVAAPQQPIAPPQPYGQPPQQPPYGEPPYGQPPQPGQGPGPGPHSTPEQAPDGPAAPDQNPGSQVPPQGTPSGQQPPPQQPPAPPPQSPYGQPGPNGPPPPPMPPWQDPNRYGPPQGRLQPPPNRPDDPWQRQRQQQRPPAQQEKDKRAPLDLRTRWARGLALGSIVCTLLAIWYSISNFPTWLVGAGAGLVLGLVGLWLGVFAQRAALAKGKRAPQAVTAIVWSSIATLMSLMIVAFSLIFYTQLSQLSQCERAATTIAAQNQCETNFKNQFGGTS
jgi:hypothetical protein